MKKSLLIILFAIYRISSSGQTSIEGTFLNDRDTLSFRNDSVCLVIMSNGGLIFPIHGAGEFRIAENILIITTGNNQHKPSRENIPRQLGNKRYLENETVIFKINEQTENRLALVLIGICDNREFKGQKTIKKFERDQKRFDYRKRELIRKN